MERTLINNEHLIARNARLADRLGRLSLRAVVLRGIEMPDPSLQHELAAEDGAVTRLLQPARTVTPRDGGDRLAVRELECALDGHGLVMWESVGYLERSRRSLKVKRMLDADDV